tara:strand:- start:2199 stop:2528 length:330 start_codon:yes stop_codon:yes gene_type:complete
MITLKENTRIVYDISCNKCGQTRQVELGTNLGINISPLDRLLRLGQDVGFKVYDKDRAFCVDCMNGFAKLDADKLNELCKGYLNSKMSIGFEFYELGLEIKKFFDNNKW